jgi:nucleoside-diphosphate-sugar epimerase
MSGGKAEKALETCDDKTQERNQSGADHTASRIDAARPTEDRLMNKTVLVTGADGFTGGYVTRDLAVRGYRVIGLTRRDMPAADFPQCATLVSADLMDQPALEAIIGEARPDAVMHLAAISFVAHGDADAIYTTNLNGTRHLLEALKRTHRPDSVLLASSANVYGNATPGAISEDAVLAPANDYAVSKVAMEFMAGLYRDSLPLIVTRPFNYTGVGQSENFLLPKIVSHIRRGAESIELGNLDVARDFSDVRMVAEAYRRLIENPAAVGQAVNICSGKAHTLKEVIRMACDIAGREIEVRVNPAFVRANEVRVLQGDRTRLDSVAPDLPAYDLSDTLRWMIEAP